MTMNLAYRTTVISSGAMLVCALLATPAQADEPWHDRPLPELRAGSAVTDLASPAADQVWIVGYQGLKAGYAGNPVLRRWTGSRWAGYSLPDFSSDGTLLSVSSNGPDEVWVGGTHAGEGYAARWDGTRWRKVRLPAGIFRAEPETGPAGTWVEGRINGTLHRRDGDSWSPPISVPVQVVRGLKARTATDAWAVGAGVTDDDTMPAAAHWDGTSWQGVLVPDPHSEGAVLEDVLPLAADDVWLVGTSYTRGEPRSTEPLLYRWNGTSLLPVALPADVLSLSGIVRDGAGVIWVSGQSIDTPDQPVLLRRDGNGWTRVPVPATGDFVVHHEGRDQLSAVPGTTALWLLGAAYPTGSFLYGNS